VILATGGQQHGTEDTERLLELALDGLRYQPHGS